jgi:hypothetical protein
MKRSRFTDEQIAYALRQVDGGTRRIPPGAGTAVLTSQKKITFPLGRR